MKKVLALFVTGIFLTLASCGPREDRQEDQRYDNDTIPETQMQDQTSAGDAVRRVEASKTSADLKDQEAESGTFNVEASPEKTKKPESPNLQADPKLKEAQREEAIQSR